MTALALGLILAAAVVHATWNLLAKRAGSAGLEFVWLFGLTASVTYAPIALGYVLVRHPDVGAAGFGFMAGSGVLHLGYYLLLQRGYRSGDLSLVYPVARGAGPLLSTAGAVAIFGERPGPLTIAGGLLVCAGVFLLAGGGTATRTAVLFGLATGVLIGSYTLWDKHAVTELAVAPLLLDWGSNATRTTLLTVPALRRKDLVRRAWSEFRREAIGIGVLSPLAYILVLSALAVAPVSSIAPAREVSILIGTALGARFLGEGNLRRRILAAALVVVGLAALARG